MNQVYIPFLILISSCATCFRVALCKDSVASLPVECWDLDPLLATETIAIYQQDWDFNDVVGISIKSPEDVKDLWKNEIGSSWHKEASTWRFLVGWPWTTLFCLIFRTKPRTYQVLQGIFQSYVVLEATKPWQWLKTFLTLYKQKCPPKKRHLFVKPIHPLYIVTTRSTSA